MTEEVEIEIRNSLEVLQPVIDISAERLEGLRTQCATSAELTQQEIRTLEGKLIKLFSRQLVNKSKLSEEHLPADKRNIPKLGQWLKVVGLSEVAIEAITSKMSTLEALQEKSDHELKTMLLEKNAREEEVRRLTRALQNLKKYTEILLRGDFNNEPNDLKLYWDSWDRHKGMTTTASPRPSRSKPTRSSIPSEDGLHCNNNNHTLNSTNKISYAVSLTSINNTTPTHHTSHGKGDKSKYPTTPPPHKSQHCVRQNLLADGSLIKSKSHESQLSGNENIQIKNGDGHHTVSRRGRLSAEPGANCKLNVDSNSLKVSSPIKSPAYNSAGESDDSSHKNLCVPKPVTPTLPRPIMGHIIAHRFTKTYKMMTTCDYCEKQMFIGTGLKCKECKYKCHRDCESKVPPSCQLPKQLLEEFKANNSPNLGRASVPSPKSRIATRGTNQIRKPSYPQSSIPVPSFTGPDSSSTSSCNSSTPSSPALVMTNVAPQTHGKGQFVYPEVNQKSGAEKNVTQENKPSKSKPGLQELVETNKSQDSDKTISIGSGSLSTDSERTPFRLDSQDSQFSDSETDRGWPRQNSLSYREWDIPFEELETGDVIGVGRFATVYRGQWHGDVAIKAMNMDYLDDEKRLDAFKLEVATFRKTRHHNVILFMGACMNRHLFAIITSLSKGMTLYTHIHLRKDKFTMNKSTIIAQQITQGMSYLHSKGIVHRDLKTKNIFLENGKVVITDFGLFSMNQLCYNNRRGVQNLIITPGWLCYLSPEIMRSLRSSYQPGQADLPFSKASDIYAFGTVWYELLCGDWPFKGQLPEPIIWQVGKGMKQSLANLQASRDVKDILMMCWSFQPEDRPDFTSLSNSLEKIPKKKLARSPSHPIHLSRSAESVF